MPIDQVARQRSGVGADTVPEPFMHTGSSLLLMALTLNTRGSALARARITYDDSSRGHRVAAMGTLSYVQATGAVVQFSSKAPGTRRAWPRA